LDRVRDLHHVEQGGHARHDVLAHGGRGRHEGVVVAGKRDDGRSQRLGHALGESVGFGEQHLAHALELRGGIGGCLRALAGDQHVDIATHPERGRQRLGGLVGEGGVVVFGNEKNGHLACSLFGSTWRLGHPYSTPASFFSLSTSSATSLTLTPALRPPGSSVFSTFSRALTSAP